MMQQSLGLMIAPQGHITGKKYEAILQDQLLPIIQTLSHYDDPVFQDDNVFTHTATQMQKQLLEQQDEVRRLQGPPESPHLTLLNRSKC